MQNAQMSYLEKLKLAGYPFVGLSADWVNAAYRVVGNDDAGEVIFDCEDGMLERIAYTHNDDGERTDVVLSRFPNIA